MGNGCKAAALAGHKHLWSKEAVDKMNTMKLILTLSHMTSVIRMALERWPHFQSLMLRHE